MSSTTATPTATPSAPLPPAAVSALHRLEAAFSPVLAEQHRIERRLAALKVGESAVINGTPVTVIDVATADLLERDRAVSAECRRRSAAAVTSADYDALLCVQDELAMCRCQLGVAS